MNDKKYFAVICAIIKDEVDLKEWIAYHIILGFEQIFIYDNESKIPVKEVVKSTPLETFVTVIDWKINKKHVQAPAYNDFFKNNPDIAEWVAVIDGDEFIVLKKHKNIKEFLNDYQEFHAVGLNWKEFGSNGLIDTPDDKLVIQAYTRCMSRIHHTMKRFYRPGWVERCRIHHAILREGGRDVDVMKNPISGPHNDNDFQGVQDIAYVHHYRLKSHEDYKRRMKRGGANKKVYTVEDFVKLNEQNNQVLDSFMLDEKMDEKVMNFLEGEKQRKIYQIGFNKTGTRSFTNFFNRNGIKTIHHSKNYADDVTIHLSKTIFDNHERGRPLLEGFEEYQAYADMTHWDEDGKLKHASEELFKKMYKEDPDGIFILNIRPVEDWIKSRAQHPNGSGGYLRKQKKAYNITADEVLDMWRKEYHDHIKNVKDFFKDKDSLIVFDISKNTGGDLVKSLSKFGINCDAKHWGNANKNIEKRNRIIIRNNRDDFFFIQIGANDGIRQDPIRRYVTRYNWSGVLVEPQEDVFENLKSNYQNQGNLKFENSAITDKNGYVDFYVSPNSHISSLYYDKSNEGTKCKVKSITFSKLLEKYSIKKIDLLQIDTEGNDYEIIKQVDFSEIKPLMIHYENRHLSDEDKIECANYLRKKGYSILEVGHDTFAYIYQSGNNRVLKYDYNLLPNKYVKKIEQESNRMASAKSKTGLTIGYPAWNLLYYSALCSMPADNQEVVIVETGTNKGFSTIMLAQALKDSNRKGLVHTVDMDESNIETARENLAKAGLSEYVKLYVRDSVEFLTDFTKENQIQFAFLDANHKCEHVIKEFSIIHPVVLACNGMVYFDNTSSLGVADALKYIKEKFEGNLIQFENCSWSPPGNAIWQNIPKEPSVITPKKVENSKRKILRKAGSIRKLFLGFVRKRTLARDGEKVLRRIR